MSSASHPAITWGSRRGDVAPSTTPVVARSTSDALLAVTSSSGPTTNAHTSVARPARASRDLLRRAHAGEDPDLLYAEEYANSEVERFNEGDNGG